MKWIHKAGKIVLGGAVAAGAVLASVASPAAEPAFPDGGVVKIIVPFSPGGPTDGLVRIIQQDLQKVWTGSNLIIDYKAGADTIIGTDYVAKSAPDGRTLGVVVTAHTINPSLHSKMPYDTTKDLAGVTQLVNTPLALVTYAKAPFNTVPELIAYAKKHPGTLTYGTPGSGTSTHLAGELFKTAAGIDLAHIPYKGSAPAQIDLVAGRVDVMFDVFSSVLPFVKSGKLKVLGLSLDHRLPNYEQYPAIAETIPHFNVSSVIGVVAPAGTPKPVLMQIQSGFAKAMNEQDVKDRLASFAMERVASTPEQFDALIQSEITRWGKIVKANHIHAD